MNCQFCGWGDHIQPSCTDYNAAAGCQLNRENLRKYYLNHRDDRDVMVVRSVRYQDPTKNKFGAYYEHLEKVGR